MKKSMTTSTNKAGKGQLKRNNKTGLWELTDEQLNHLMAHVKFYLLSTLEERVKRVKNYIGKRTDGLTWEEAKNVYKKLFNILSDIEKLKKKA